MLKRVMFVVLALACVRLASESRLFAAEPAPCALNADARMLDYWTGNWSVGTSGAPNSGHSKVSLSLDKCLLVEEWGSNTSPHNGTNLLAYNAEYREWDGLFVDNHGRVHVLTGTVSTGAGEFKGPSRDANGRTVLNRVRVIRVSPVRVDQSWEKSTDDGETWTTEYRMEYARKP
jgi:hypothetical protein